MKKSLIVFIFAALAMFSLCFAVKVKADEVTQVGKVVFHYQLWADDADYSDAGLWTWNNGTGGTSAPVTSTVTDDFGGVYEITIMSDAADKIGLIPCRQDITKDTRWNYRETPDGYQIDFDVTSIKDGTTDRIDVYYFQGGLQNYFIADPTQANVLLLYYGASGSYESNLGIHAWGWTDPASVDWGTPAKVFKDGFKSPGNVQGKAAMLKFEPGGAPGVLIYAGTDATKKHSAFGDLKEETLPGFFSSMTAGDVKVIYVSGGTVFDGVEKKDDFVANAFMFGFIPFVEDELSGTFAKSPTVIFAKTTISVPTKEEGDTEEYVVEEKIGERIVVTPSDDGWKLPTDLPSYTQYDKPDLPSNVKGRVLFHYQKWDGDYSDVGLWTWGNGTDGSVNAVTMAGVDNFGAVMEILVDDDADDQNGVIPIAKDINADTRWNYRETPDGSEIKLDLTPIKNGTTTQIDVYYFQGGLQNYFIADATKANVLLVYYEPTGTYAENVGVHAWNYTNPDSPAWGTPAQIFKDFTSPVNVTGKAGLLQFTPGADPGCLIYAGDDASKKTGDISESSLSGFFSTMQAGSVKVVYTVAGQLFTERTEFAPGAFGGTITIEDVYGPVTKTRVVMDPVDLSQYFTLKQGDTIIQIKEINYNHTADETNEFVIQLEDANKLDPTKEYTLYFDNGKEGELQMADQLVLTMDSEKPVINIVGDNVVKIEQGVKWDNSLFPVIRVTDNRDDNLTSRVYVKDGYVNTNKVGEYTVKLQVEDFWGNVGESQFTIKVEKAEGKGCGGDSASILASVGLLGLVFFFRRRRIV